MRKDFSFADIFDQALSSFIENEDDKIKFQEWSFGKVYDPKVTFPKVFLQTWRKRHSDLFDIDEDDDVFDCLIKMIDAWKDRENNEM